MSVHMKKWKPWLWSNPAFKPTQNTSVEGSPDATDFSPPVPFENRSEFSPVRPSNLGGPSENGATAAVIIFLMDLPKKRWQLFYAINWCFGANISFFLDPSKVPKSESLLSRGEIADKNLNALKWQQQNVCYLRLLLIRHLRQKSVNWLFTLIIKKFRTVYYRSYKDVTRKRRHTVPECCPGWVHIPGEVGCQRGMFCLLIFWSCRYTLLASQGR